MVTYTFVVPGAHSCTLEASHSPYLPGLGVLLVHAFLGLLEQAHSLLDLIGQVLHHYPEVLVLPQGLHLALVAGEDGAQVLVGVWQQVQDVGRAVLQSHFWVLAQTHHLCGKARLK